MTGVERSEEESAALGVVFAWAAREAARGAKAGEPGSLVLDALAALVLYVKRGGDGD